MSTDTIPARSNGQTIDETWFNLLRTVLGGNIVPRNTSGAATSAAGSLGTDTYRFHNLNMVSSGVITTGSGTLAISSDKWTVTDQGGNAFAISEITTSLIGAAADNSTDLGSFTGSTIGSDQNIKTCLQDLETQVDTNVLSIAELLNTPMGGQASALLSTNNQQNTQYEKTVTLPTGCSFELYWGVIGTVPANVAIDLQYNLDGAGWTVFYEYDNADGASPNNSAMFGGGTTSFSNRCTTSLGIKIVTYNSAGGDQNINAIFKVTPYRA